MTFNISRTALVLFSLITSSAIAQITWPQDQLLPSFPASAKNQDLIYMNGTSVINETVWKWEAEGNTMSHGTGRLETDGWLCQSGIDAPNAHMLYGPYATNVTAGPNTAEFRMKIDNNTANNDAVVDIDVRNASTGVTLASQTVTRQQFTVASNYTSFRLPFIMPADNQSIELRIYWRGNSYIKVDYVSVQQNNYAAENYLFASLKGLVNRTQPRIFSYEGDNFAEGPYTWMQSLGLTWTEYTDKWQLITKYRNEISGVIVYDPSQIHTVNLATMLAKDKKALIASPSLVARLTSAPYNLPILTDLRGQFTSKLQVYQSLYNTYWPTIDKRVLIGLNPDAHQAAAREYASAIGAAVIWLDPKVSGESELLNSFLSTMPAGANFMGWWPEEEPGVSRASQYGIATIASDWASNLTVHSGMSRTVNVKQAPPKPALQNKIYVAFILSDGDNLQYVEHLMRKLWNNPDRGAVPIGWTVSPAMLDAMPGALNYYHQTSTNNDNLISGPSGYGYSYPNNYPDQNSLNRFVSKSEEYNRRAGLRVLTIWNTITGGINQNVGEAFATYAPSLLGLTGQNTGGPLSIYKQSLPGQPLSCNYCTNEQAMKDHIASAANGWNGNEPRFVIIQAQPWTDVKPTNFKNVANSLNSNYVVVRPDHLFQLMRESKGLSVDPNPNPVGTFYKDCNYTGTSVSLAPGDYKLSDLVAKGIVDNDISSIKLNEGYEVVLYDGDNFTAGSTVVQESQSCLNTSWNDKTTSLRLRIKNGTGDGLTANYFNGMNFETPKFSRVDANINFDWGNGSPNAAINADQFSARWTGQIQPRFTGEYTFYMNSDNGRRLWVNNQLVIDKWVDDWGTEYAGKVTLTGGQKYDIKIEYFENNGGANCKLEWSSAVQTREVVPQSQLYSNALPVVAITSPANNAGFVALATFTINATASDANGTVAKVDFYNGMTLLGSKTTTPYSYSWTNVAAGTYSITAQATDDKGAVTVSAPVTVKVNVNQNPVVSITVSSPSPNTISITATATDGDGTITKVDYYDGTTKVGASTSAPYTLILNGVVAGNHAITAVATDDKGGTTTSAVVNVSVSNPPNQLPLVSITAPASNAVYVALANVTLTANATDADGSVAKVEFYSGSTLLSIVSASPYSYVWNNVSAGTYSITAKAYDNLGATTTSQAITVKVNTNQKPVVSVNAVSSSPNTVTITATANDTDGSIVKVEYYDGTTKIGESVAQPYSYTWTNVTTGTHSITAVATDDKGGKTTSDIVTVVVENPNQAPGINITSPTGGAVFEANATVHIIADATDQDGSIARVEFYSGSTKLGESTTAPYTFDWSAVAAGSYDLSVIAVDNRGATGQSAIVRITVNTLTTSVVDLQQNREVYLYPNPVQSVLYFSKEVTSVVVSDLTGSVHETIHYTTDKIDMRGYAAGIYILQYGFKGQNFYYRIVKE